MQAKNGRLNGMYAETAPIADLLARMAADPGIGILGAGGGQEMSGAPSSGQSESAEARA